MTHFIFEEVLKLSYFFSFLIYFFLFCNFCWFSFPGACYFWFPNFMKCGANIQKSNPPICVCRQPKATDCYVDISFNNFIDTIHLLWCSTTYIRADDVKVMALQMLPPVIVNTMLWLTYMNSFVRPNLSPVFSSFFNCSSSSDVSSLLTQLFLS